MLCFWKGMDIIQLEKYGEERVVQYGISEIAKRVDSGVACDIWIKCFQIILYGSVARNEATEDSDIDIAIILDHSIDEAVRERFIDWAADMDMKYDCVLSIVDIEKEKYDVWKNTMPFYKNVFTEGVVLWKAA